MAYFDDDATNAFIKEQTGSNQTVLGYISRLAPKAGWAYSTKGSPEPFVVLEAISEGVSLSTMSNLQADYLVALRPRLSKVDKLKALAVAFSHYAKPYDFNFDFATDHALVCTELLWRSFRPGPEKKGLRIPLITIMGRKTLPANQIAELYATEHGTPNQQFQFVAFLDGRERQRRAVVADEDAFIQSHRRTKWDVFLE